MNWGRAEWGEKKTSRAGQTIRQNRFSFQTKISTNFSPHRRRVTVHNGAIRSNKSMIDQRIFPWFELGSSCDRLRRLFGVWRLAEQLISRPFSIAIASEECFFGKLKLIAAHLCVNIKISSNSLNDRRERGRRAAGGRKWRIVLSTQVSYFFDYLFLSFLSQPPRAAWARHLMNKTWFQTINELFAMKNDTLSSGRVTRRGIGWHQTSAFRWVSFLPALLSCLPRRLDTPGKNVRTRQQKQPEMSKQPATKRVDLLATTATRERR